jgi:hypothetical protein
VVITAVTATTITVASGSFTAGAETGVITLATNCIYTAGSDFTGFVVGNTIEVSGATTTANNRYAVITAVADDVLTFVSGIFTASVDAAAVTITVPKIKMTYESLPTAKLIANIATDTLNLSDKWLQVYDFFCMAKIAYLDKDYQEYANHMASFNAEVARYEDWWENHRPMSPEDDMVASEEEYYNSSVDFDTEA